MLIKTYSELTPSAYKMEAMTDEGVGKIFLRDTQSPTRSRLRPPRMEQQGRKLWGPRCRGNRAGVWSSAPTCICNRMGHMNNRMYQLTWLQKRTGNIRQIVLKSSQDCANMFSVWTDFGDNVCALCMDWCKFMFMWENGQTLIENIICICTHEKIEIYVMYK